MNNIKTSVETEASNTTGSYFERLSNVSKFKKYKFYLYKFKISNYV